MDWDLAIKRNSEALIEIVADLFAMLGIVALTDTVSRLPWPAYRAVLRVLRPAENVARLEQPAQFVRDHPPGQLAGADVSERGRVFGFHCGALARHQPLAALRDRAPPTRVEQRQGGVMHGPCRRGSRCREPKFRRPRGSRLVFCASW